MIHPYLFIYHSLTITFYFLVYVGDLLVIWNNINFINQFLNALATWLFVKDLHDLYYFLAIEIIPIVSGLHLTQHNYIRYVLSKTNRTSAKECVTPMSSSQPLQLQDKYVPTDVTQYHQFISAL